MAKASPEAVVCTPKRRRGFLRLRFSSHSEGMCPGGLRICPNATAPVPVAPETDFVWRRGKGKAAPSPERSTLTADTTKSSICSRLIRGSRHQLRHNDVHAAESLLNCPKIQIHYILLSVPCAHLTACLVMIRLLSTKERLSAQHEQLTPS